MKKKNGRQHDHSPEAAKPLLPMEALAALLDGGDQISIQALAALRPVIRSDPRLVDEIRALEALAEEAGLGDGRQFETALATHAELDQLMRAEGWTHPAEVLDPHDVTGIGYRELVHLAEARVKRAENPNDLRGVIRKLHAAWNDQKAQDRLNEFVADTLARTGQIGAKRALRVIGERLGETFDDDVEPAVHARTEEHATTEEHARTEEHGMRGNRARA